jgi:hypothetical protein
MFCGDGKRMSFPGRMTMSNLADRNGARLASPSSGHLRSFVVGQSRHGGWVALETHGVAGGVFVSRDAARRYAEYETDHRPGAVRFASSSIELKI